AVTLLAKGLLIRGGIAKGPLYHDDSIVFGPALIEAYQLETGVAKFPRVILSRDVYADFRHYREHTEASEYFEGAIWLSDDGSACVNVLAALQEINRQQTTPEFLNSSEVLNAQRCQSALQQLIDQSMHEPRHFEKIKWFAIQWNTQIAPRQG